MKNDFQKYAFINRRFSGLIIFVLLFYGICAGHTTKAAEAVDQQNTQSGTITTSIIGQSFTPAVNNISAVELSIGSYGFSGTATGTLYVCYGLPDTAAPSNNLGCHGSGQLLIAQTGFTATWITAGMTQLKISLPGSYPVTPELSSYFFVIDNRNSILMRDNTSGGYSRGSMFTDAGASSYDMAFKTYYDTGAPTISVGMPAFNQTYTSNNITFQGTTTNADDFSIYWGTSSPTNLIYGTNIYNRRPLVWDFEDVIPDGQWTIWHIAKQGTTTVTSTSTIYIANQYGDIGGGISSSTMSSTSAANVLYNVKTTCNYKSIVYIDDPAEFWATNTPAALNNGSSTASTSPAVYNVLTRPLYNLLQPVIRALNGFSCYFAIDNALEKGQAVAVTILSYIGIISGINAVMFGGFPGLTLLMIWGIGMVLWFTRRVLPFGK